ncbi:GAP family protein [Nocardia jiangxiensis]|uniref:GAP family protein n=1 Tax=Nocardia jiangxiensis TaxID=282685 RepID=UPI0003087D65|nr:GAP family protein [Nocardia jiangxiensis]
MLGTSIGQILSHGVGVAISPLALVAIILLLATPRARANAVTFAITWIVALAVIVAVLIAISGLVGASHHDHPATWVGWAKLVIGLAALAIAAQQARRALHPAPDSAPPAWAQIITLATTLAVVNPKNLTQLAAAAVTISSVTPGHGARVIAGVVFLLIASLCVTIPLAIHLFAGERANTVLTSWKDWATRHNSTIMAVLLTILGTKSVGDAIATLTN